jgi:hypothetical protein
LSHERIDPILSFPLSQTTKQLRAFLGVIGFCRIWFPKYAALARPLYQLLKDAHPSSQSLLEWDPENKGFSSLQSGTPNCPIIELAYPRPLSTVCL